MMDHGWTCRAIPEEKQAKFNISIGILVNQDHTIVFCSLQVVREVGIGSQMTAQTYIYMYAQNVS